MMSAQSYWSGRKLYWEGATETIVDHQVEATKA